MKYAIVKNNIIENIIELHPLNAAEFEGAVPLVDIPANIGDIYENEKFYRDGQEVLTVSAAAQKDINEYYTILDILGVFE